MYYMRDGDIFFKHIIINDIYHFSIDESDNRSGLSGSTNSRYQIVTGF